MILDSQCLNTKHYTLAYMKHHNIFSYISLVQRVWTHLCSADVAVGSHNTWHVLMAPMHLCHCFMLPGFVSSDFPVLLWCLCGHKSEQNSTFKYFMNTVQIMNRWPHCHADLKEHCALEEDIRLQLMSNCSKHSRWEGMRH